MPVNLFVSGPMLEQALPMKKLNHQDHERIKSKHNGNAGGGHCGTLISNDQDRKTNLKITK